MVCLIYFLSRKFFFVTIILTPNRIFLLKKIYYIFFIHFALPFSTLHVELYLFYMSSFK